MWLWDLLGLLLLGGMILGCACLLVGDLRRAVRKGARVQPKVMALVTLLGPCIALVGLSGLEIASAYEWEHKTHADTRWVWPIWRGAAGLLVLGLPVSALFGIVATRVDTRPGRRPAVPSDPLGAALLVAVHILAWIPTALNLALSE
jgi:hypothetical protein